MMGSSLVFSLALRALPYAGRLLPYAGIAALAGWLYLQGQWSAERKAELADARATIEVLEEQSRRNALAVEAATQAAQRRARTEADLNKKVEDYETALKARGDAGCLLNDDDVGRLHGLR